MKCSIKANVVDAVFVTKKTMLPTPNVPGICLVQNRQQLEAENYVVVVFQLIKVPGKLSEIALKAAFNSASLSACK